MDGWSDITRKLTTQARESAALNRSSADCGKSVDSKRLLGLMEALACSH